MGSSKSEVAAVACMHASIRNSQTWPHFPGHFSNFPRCCVGVRSFAPLEYEKCRTAHLSRNNARSNYITLSGKGAADVPASNLFALSPPRPFPLSLTLSTRLFQTFSLKVRNWSRVRKHRGSGGGGGKKREAPVGQSGEFSLQHFFPFSFAV